ncbi:MAG: preprotein translocase subunit SecG [Patescibacteria group bacterium]
MNIISYIQITSAVLLIITILLQQKGNGLGSTFGGSGGEYSTKRGAERVIFGATIVLAVIFIATSVLRVLAR